MESPGGFAVVDWLIVAAYALFTLYLGWYFGRRQQSIREYFSGSGNMNPVLIGVSLFASLLSTVTYLSLPGEMIGKGPIYLSNYLAYPFIFWIVGYSILPVYMKLRVTSAYELLEERLGLSVRLLGASMFLLLRLVWMSLLVYAAARAFSYIVDVDEKFVPLIVLIIGSISLFYASLGGLRAVVVTDLLQTILLYGGAVLVVVVVTVSTGGFDWFPTTWNPDWDSQPFFSLDPGVRATVIGSIVSMLIWFVATSGGDQVSVQRFMATTDLKAARRSLALQLVLAAVVGVTLGIAGFAMLGYFQLNPDQLPAGFSLKQDADNVFPRFIAFHLPPVVSGLVASGMLAAAMSSIDSGINSISAVVTTDFVDRFRVRPLAETDHVRMARWLAVAVGVVVLVGSSLIGRVPGNILAVTNKTVNLLSVPIFCLFVFALFVPGATKTGVWAGCIAGVVAGALVAFSGPIVTFGVNNWGWSASTFGVEMTAVRDSATGLMVRRAPDPISFQWISTISLIANMLVGWLVSRLSRPRGPVAGFAAVACLATVVGAVGLSGCGPRKMRTADENVDAKALAVLRDGLWTGAFWPSMHAAEGLTLAGHGDEVVAGIKPLLNTVTDDRERCGVARELVRAGDSSAVAVLVEILRKPNDYAHTHAAESLYKLGLVGDEAAMQRAAASDDPIRRLMASAALARNGSEGALRYIRETYETGDDQSMRIAAWLLGRIGDESDIARLKSRLEDAPPGIIRATVEHALAALGDADGLSWLKQNLSSSDADIRTYAATFAGELGRPEFVGRLAPLLDDPNQDTRIRAAQSILVLDAQRQVQTGSM